MELRSCIKITHEHTIFSGNCMGVWGGVPYYPETYSVKILPQIYFYVQNIGMKKSSSQRINFLVELQKSRDSS
jgi:hypothetical protein